MAPSSISAQERMASALRQIRQSKNESATSFAKGLGVSRNTLYLLETGAGNAELTTVDRLACALNIDPCEFFDYSPEQHQSYRRKFPLSRTVSFNIAVFRKQAHLSQERLGEEARLQVGYVQLIESSSRNISLSTLDKIANALQIDVTFLLADDGSTELP